MTDSDPQFAAKDVPSALMRQTLQREYHSPLPDIPRVQDMVHLPEDVEHFRSQHAVGVGDDTEAHYIAAAARNPRSAPIPSQTKSTSTISCVMAKGGSDCVGASAINAGKRRNSCVTRTKLLR